MKFENFMSKIELFKYIFKNSVFYFTNFFLKKVNLKSTKFVKIYNKCQRCQGIMIIKKMKIYNDIHVQ